MSTHEPERFLSTWEQEARGTIQLLKGLPVAKYDFRPDPQGRSLGELAWHLAEIDAYVSHSVESGRFDMNSKPPNIDRPRTVEALAPGYERIHREAVARLERLRPEDFDRQVQFYDGAAMTIREVLWRALLHHSIHHRGELVLMCRLAGCVPPGLYGPTREAMESFRQGG